MRTACVMVMMSAFGATAEATPADDVRAALASACRRECGPDPVEQLKAELAELRRELAALRAEMTAGRCGCAARAPIAAPVATPTPVPVIRSAGPTVVWPTPVTCVNGTCYRR